MGSSGLRMFRRLQYDPTANPINPNRMIILSFSRTDLLSPSFEDQNVIISINGGKIRARAELLKAPTREITAPKFGMAMANTKVIKTKTVLVMYSATSLDLSDVKCFSMNGHTMLKGT